MKSILTTIALAACLTLGSARAETADIATSPELPSCDAPLTAYYVRTGYEASGNVLVASLADLVEAVPSDGTRRQCRGTLIALDGRHAVTFEIGWHDAERSVPSFSGDVIKPE
ncbi:hypothetical protein [Lutibaculum baratangense]|uniref:hypothetical protein n=1 Tax=Lutibaculum baratangense TaxID=1358440 RepID=UPI0012694434|nr:hypothetical protein [Lutibaculum baratangense]